jgi:hypothetical protein
MSKLVLKRKMQISPGRWCRAELQPAQAQNDSDIIAGRIPRITRWMALAIHLVGLLETGRLKNHRAISRLGFVTPARVSQLLSLVHLAPDIQEELLGLPVISKGRNPIQLRHLLPVARQLDWRKQRAAWSAWKNCG